MGWFEDACDWVSTAVEDVGEAVGDAVEAVGEAVEEVVDWVGDAVEDVGEAVAATVTGAVETVIDFGEAVGDTLSGRDPVETWNEFGMNALDNMVFDPVDYLTGGDVNLDYDDGTFTADVDLNLGIGAVGLHVGEAGFDASASFDIGIASGNISLDSSTGFTAGGSIGIADGPWPFAEGHLSLTPDGEVLIGGELQGSLPFPGGFIGGGIAGELVRNEDGSWGASASIDGELDGPMGTGGYFHADADATIDPGEGEFDISGNLDAGASGPGGTHLDTHTGFDLGLDDGRLEGMVEGDVSAGAGGADLDLGGRVAAGAGAGGPSIDIDRWGDLDLPDTSGGPGALGRAVLDPAGPGAAAADTSSDALDGGAGTPQFDDPFAGGADGFGQPAGDASEVPQVEVPSEPEPPVDDFSEQIQAVDQLMDKADDMWDDLGQ